MSISVSNPAQIRRSQTPEKLISAEDLAPGQHFIDGAFRPGSSGAVHRRRGSLQRGADRISRRRHGRGQSTPPWPPPSPRRGVGPLAPKERSEILHRIADRVAETPTCWPGSSRPTPASRSWSPQDDVAGTIDTFRFMAGALRATTSMAAGTYAEDHLSVILREPLGVIGVVTPWNYPLLMAAWKIAPILAAGNTLVIKPSEQTPLTTLKFAELVADILPPGVLNVVTGYGPWSGPGSPSTPTST